MAELSWHYLSQATLATLKIKCLFTYIKNKNQPPVRIPQFCDTKKLPENKKGPDFCPGP